MPETLSHSPTTREHWQAHRHEENVVMYGAEEQNGGTFLYPKKLDDYTDRATLAGALHEAVGQEQQGMVHGKAAELRNSPHWNDLAKGTPEDAFVNDEHVQGYLAERGNEVMNKDAEIQRIYVGVAEMFTAGVHEGMAQGYIPEYVEPRLQAAVEQTAIQVVDPAFFGKEHGHDHGHAVTESATYDNRDDQLKIRSDMEEDPGVIIFHELDHKLSGGTFVTDTETGEPARTRVGFSENKHITHTGLTEVINHHLALGIQSGNFDTLDPDERGDGDRIYYAQRKILANMLDKSQGIMQLKTETRASYEDTTAAGATLPDRRAMVTESRNAYGPAAFRKFDILSQAANAIPNDENYGANLQALMDRVKPPVLDAAGKVVHRGIIDISGL